MNYCVNTKAQAQPAQQPDAYCVTTPDGGCCSTDPRCMHQPDPWRGLALELLEALRALRNGPSWTHMLDVDQEVIEAAIDKANGGQQP